MSAKVSIIDRKLFVQIDGETLGPPEAILALRSLQAEAADELREAETAMVDAERSHGVALADGEEPDRDIVTAAKADIDLARKAVKTIEADLGRVHAEIVTHEATLMIDTAVADIERDTGIRPDLNESLARNVAELGIRLAVAEAEYREAIGEVENVRDRVNGIDQRIGEITRKRLEGEATAGNASELAALDYDIRTLRKSMGSAKQKAASLDPHELRSQHQRTVADWNSYIRDAMLKALAAVVQSREKELVDALTKLVDNR
jgi:predicted  nucleic acid-binding Zn-ribbon protein